MTTKEITELRKSGRLQEALQAAETEFANNVNKYTVGAIYWCLNDLYKQQDKEEATHTIARMKELCDKYGAKDEIMIKALASAQRSIIPYNEEIHVASDNAKAGKNVSESYSRILQAYNSNSLDASLYQNFGWLIYYVLKNTPLNDAKNRKQLLNQYLKLGLQAPSNLHSCILSEAVKVEQNTPLQFRIRDFLRLWNLDNLRSEDWEQYTTDAGHVIPSLVEKLIGVYAKEVKTDGIVAPDDFDKLIDKALTRYPQNQNMPYYKAIVLMSQGNKEEAIEYYKKLILKFPSKFYLWSQIANLVDDLDTKIGLLCKALNVGAEDKLLGGVRLRLAELLISKGLLPNAKYELRKYKEVYSAQGWGLKYEYQQVANQLTNVSAEASNQSIYTSYCSIAEAFIYRALPSTLAIKVSHNFLDDKKRPGKKFEQWTMCSKGGSFRLNKPTKYGLGKSANGTVFEIKLLDDKIVWIKPSQANLPQQDWIKVVEGSVNLRTDRNGKSYAIVSGVYVAENLLKSVASGQNVKITAFSKGDGRWQAITLVKL